MIDGKNFFDQPVKNDLITYENIQKIATRQGDDYTTGGLLGYSYSKKHYKMKAIDLTKQQQRDADTKTTQQINFTGRQDRVGQTTMFFIIEQAKKNCFRFFTRKCRSILILFFALR